MGTNVGAGFAHTRYASDSDLEKLGMLGEIFWSTGNDGNATPYKLVQVDTNLINNQIAADEVLYYTSTANEVTNDRSRAISDSANHYAGVAPSDLSAAVPESTSSVTYFMLIQVGGYHESVKTNGDDDIVAGDLLIASGDGTCDSSASPGVAEYIGTATAADDDSNDTVAAHLVFKA